MHACARYLRTLYWTRSYAGRAPMLDTRSYARAYVRAYARAYAFDELRGLGAR